MGKKHLKKLICAILLAMLFFACSMIDTKGLIPQEDDLIDCKIGKYTFELMRKDCNDQSINH